MDKPKLSDYLGWRLRAKLRLAQVILGIYWNGVWFCRRMGWSGAEDFCRFKVPDCFGLKWADRIWLTAYTECWLTRAIRRELLTTESPVRRQRTHDQAAEQRQKG